MGPGLRWDDGSAGVALKFFSYLRLPCEGQLDGKPFKLEPFQAFIVGSIFGGLTGLYYAI